ncbi:MAG: hypothetical protein ACYTAN_03730 [Planctomycetota bacterium]
MSVAVWVGPATAADDWPGERGRAPWAAREIAAGEPGQPMQRESSVHYTLYADFADEAYMAKLISDLEIYFSGLQKEFWDFIPPRHREAHLEFFVFRSESAFYEFGAGEGLIAHGTKGFLNRDRRRAAILVQEQYHKDITIAVHELTHVFNSFCAPDAPVWLDEGMAQFYSYFAAAEKGNENMTDGVNFAAIAGVDTALRLGTMLRLSDLLLLDDVAFYGDGRDLNFAAAWAFVHYLRRGVPDDADLMFSRFYGLLAEGSDSVEAFKAVYGGNLNLIERFWLSYLDRLYRGGSRGPETEPPSSTAGPAEKGPPAEATGDLRTPRQRERPDAGR